MGSYGCGFGIKSTQWNVVGEEGCTFKDVVDAIACAEYLGGGYRVCVVVTRPGEASLDAGLAAAVANPTRNDFICLRVSGAVDGARADAEDAHRDVFRRCGLKRKPAASRLPAAAFFVGTERLVVENFGSPVVFEFLADELAPLVKRCTSGEQLARLRDAYVAGAAPLRGAAPPEVDDPLAKNAALARPPPPPAVDARASLFAAADADDADGAARADARSHAIFSAPRRPLTSMQHDAPSFISASLRLFRTLACGESGAESADAKRSAAGSPPRDRELRPPSLDSPAAGPRIPRS